MVHSQLLELFFKLYRASDSPRQGLIRFGSVMLCSLSHTVESIEYCISKVQCEHWLIFVHSSCLPGWFKWYKWNISKFCDIIYVDGSNNHKITWTSVCVCLILTQTKIGKFLGGMCCAFMCDTGVGFKLQNQSSSITVDNLLWG